MKIIDQIIRWWQWRRYVAKQRQIRRENRWARIHASFMAGKNPDPEDE